MTHAASTAPPAIMLCRVYNAGEIPALAHGWRSVIAMHPGRKWITVIDWATLETARIEIAVWEKLGPQPDSRINRRKVRRIMRRRLKYTASTRPIAEALRLPNGKAP
jgi:hypothetical protein